jgi:hypothetical protein
MGSNDTGRELNREVANQPPPDVAEEKREIAEGQREAAEGARQTGEYLRKIAERARADAEGSRLCAEEARRSAEQARRNAEHVRQAEEGLRDDFTATAEAVQDELADKQRQLDELQLKTARILRNVVTPDSKSDT